MSLIDPTLKAVRADSHVFPSADSIALALETNRVSAQFVSRAVPTLEAEALAICDGNQLPVTLKGVGDGYEEIAAIESAIIDGTFAIADEYGYPAIALSIGAAVDLGARPDPFNPIGIYAPRRKGRISAAAPMNAFRSDSMLVAGVWQVEQSDYDASMAITGIDRARRLFDYLSGEASAIEIGLTPGANVNDAREAIKSVLGADWHVLTRREQQSQSFRMIAVEKWITFLMLTFILIIASFNVVSTLSMLIIEKRDNMNTLRALGATSRTLGAIFFWEGWLISMVGGITGLAGGLILCLAQQHLGLIRLNGDPTRLNVVAYPVEVAWPDLLIVTLLVAAVGALVGFIASRLARNS